MLTMASPKVIHRPSIGRYTKLEEPKARESLLTPSMRHSPSKASLKSSESTSTLATSSSTLSVDTASITTNNSVFSPMPMVQAANAALLERTAFAIDDAKDDDDEDEDFGDDTLDGGDNVMDEVGRLLPLSYSSRLKQRIG